MYWRAVHTCGHRKLQEEAWLILGNPGCQVPFFIQRLSVSRATVERAIAALIAVGKVEHRGSKKIGGYYAVR